MPTFYIRMVWANSSISQKPRWRALGAPPRSSYPPPPPHPLPPPKPPGPSASDRRLRPRLVFVEVRSVHLSVLSRMPFATIILKLDPLPWITKPGRTDVLTVRLVACAVARWQSCIVRWRACVLGHLRACMLALLRVCAFARLHPCALACLRACTLPFLRLRACAIARLCACALACAFSRLRPSVLQAWLSA